MLALDYGSPSATFEPPNHAFAHYHNIIYYWTSNMNIMSLKQIDFFHGEDCSLWLSHCMWKISRTNSHYNLCFLVLLLYYNLCDKLLQIRNVLQSTIALFKCAQFRMLSTFNCIILSQNLLQIFKKTQKMCCNENC